MTKLEDAMTELARTVKKTSETVERTSQTVEQALNRTSQTVDRTSQTVDRTSQTVDRTSQTVDRTEAMVERTSKTVERVAQTAEHTLASMDARSDRVEKNLERMRAEASQQWGEMANKMGTLVEDIVAPGIPTVFRQQFGREPMKYPGPRVRRVHRHDPGRMREFDYVAVAGDLLLVNETKSRLRPEDIPAFIEVLQEVRDYLSEAEGRAVVGCLASFSLDPSLVIAGERHGLLMVGLGTGLVRVLNSPGFEPRRF